MSKPIDDIITELTGLATGLYDFLLRTEGQRERAGWLQQLEQCRKHVVTVRLFSGQNDFHGLHDVCLVQQEYLNSLLVKSVSPAASAWERLERWPLLVLPCIATPVSHGAVEQMVSYCNDIKGQAARDADAEALRENLLKFSGSVPSAERVVSLPFASQHKMIMEPRAHVPGSDATSVRYLLQHDLMDALSGFMTRRDNNPSASQDALRLCADRIQLLGISAAGAGLTGLMDCCLLCHDALIHCLARDGTLNDADSSAFKSWTGLISRYLEKPGDHAVIDSLIDFYRRGHFIAKLNNRDYENLRELLISDAGLESERHVVVAATDSGPAQDAPINNVDIDRAGVQSAHAALDGVIEQWHTVEQHVAAARDATAQLQHIAHEMNQQLMTDSASNKYSLNDVAQRLIDASKALGLASQSAQTQINLLGELIAARADNTQYEETTAVTNINAVLIRCCSQVLAVAINGVERIFHSGSGETVRDDHGFRYCVGDLCYSASDLETLLQLPVDPAAFSATERSAILVNTDAPMPHIVFVEQVLSAQEIEVKPIGPYMPGFPGIIGVTPLSGGELAPVIDLPGLLRLRATRNDPSLAFETESYPGGGA